MIKSKDLFLIYIIGTDTLNLLIGNQSIKDYTLIKKKYFNMLMADKILVKKVLDTMCFCNLKFDKALNKVMQNY